MFCEQILHYLGIRKPEPEYKIQNKQNKNVDKNDDRHSAKQNNVWY